MTYNQLWIYLHGRSFDLIYLILLLVMLSPFFLIGGLSSIYLTSFSKELPFKTTLGHSSFSSFFPSIFYLYWGLPR